MIRRTANEDSYGIGTALEERPPSCRVAAYNRLGRPFRRGGRWECHARRRVATRKDIMAASHREALGYRLPTATGFSADFSSGFIMLLGL